MKSKFIGACLFILLVLQTGCLYAVRYDGPYHGKVVDEQTREPIEGVVVLGTWSVYHFDVGGGHSTYHNAREAVTDKKGEFTIQGEGLRIFSSLKPMDFIIFKSGYTYYQGSWDTLKTDDYNMKVIKWVDDMPIIPVRKVTNEERKNTFTKPTRPEIPTKKMMLFTHELNKELIIRGLEPYKLDTSTARGSND